MRPLALVFAAVLILLTLIVFPPWGTSLSQPPTEVSVINLPHVQKIEGEVKVRGVIRQAALHRRLDLIVPSVAREDITDLIEADTITTDGFSQITVSLHGEARSPVEQEGWIGVVLIPDETSVWEILNDRGAFHFPIEVKSKLEPRGPTDFDVQHRFDLGFGRYKVFLYNSSDRTADVNVYLYLTQ